MASNSDLYDKIRIKPRGAKKAEAEAREASKCNWADCENPGKHRAPMGRNREGEYLSLCLDHVRMYNKNYNYFSGLNDDEITKFQKENLTGHRPTWKMGTPREKANPVDETTLRETPTWHAKIRSRYNKDGTPREKAQLVRQPRRLEKKALVDLGLPASANAEQIKTKYKLLVKRHHPDSNGGDRSSEERLRQIIHAYKHLKQAGYC